MARLVRRQLRFSDRVAVVTGGGRGIGAASVRRFAADGASVVIADVDLEPAAALASEISGQGGRSLAVSCDVSNRGSVSLCRFSCSAVTRVAVRSARRFYSLPTVRGHGHR